MTVQEAESLIDEIDKAIKIGIAKGLLIALVGALILCLSENFIGKIWEDFKYWLYCKKWDWEHKEKNK